MEKEIPREKKTDKMNDNGKSRINAWISKMNYGFIDEVMEEKDIMGIKMSKGLILDLALSNLFVSLDSGESLEMIAINHLEREQK